MALKSTRRLLDALALFCAGCVLLAALLVVVVSAEWVASDWRAGVVRMEDVGK